MLGQDEQTRRRRWRGSPRAVPWAGRAAPVGAPDPSRRSMVTTSGRPSPVKSPTHMPWMPTRNTSIVVPPALRIPVEQPAGNHVAVPSHAPVSDAQVLQPDDSATHVLGIGHDDIVAPVAIDVRDTGLSPVHVPRPSRYAFQPADGQRVDRGEAVPLSIGWVRPNRDGSTNTVSALCMSLVFASV